MRRFSFAALALLFAGAACSTQAEEDVVSDEANLDYRSNVGKEFDVTAEPTVTLAGEDAALEGAARTTKAAELARTKIDSITKALNAELLRIWPEKKRESEKNIVAMVRMSSPKAGELRADGAGYKFAYSAEVAGPNNLLDSLGLAKDGERRTMTVTVDGAPIVLAWAPSPATADAYPRYEEMFEDGLDIAIHMGGDHYEPRNDLNEARGIYAELEKLGLKSPVASFDKLGLDSGPFEGALKVKGRDVAVRATLVHADMAPDTDLDKLSASFKTAASKADIVIYRGHAGTNPAYSGVVVHYNPRVAIPATAFKELELPDKPQLFVFDGCETYTGYADAIFDHPKKDEKNADIITSVNYGSALKQGESVRSLLHAVLDKAGDNWIPRSWDSILERLNGAQQGGWTSIYGVHGLSDNPKISMLADTAKIGAACEKPSDCGAPDSLCVEAAGSKVCGAACADDSACPSGTKCQGVRSQTLGATKQCFPPR